MGSEVRRSEVTHPAPNTALTFQRSGGLCHLLCASASGPNQAGQQMTPGPAAR